MKNIIAIILCSLCALSSFAEAERTRMVKGHFNVNATEPVSIDNRYGKVTVYTWDRSEVDVEVKITVEAGTEEKADRLMKKIRIIEPGKNGPVSYKTEMESTNISISTGVNAINNQRMDIDYVVHMPRKNPVNIMNKFGNVEIEDFEGKMNVQVEYGKLATGRLRNGDKYIKVGFGGLKIPSLEAAKLEISYSNADIEKAERLDIVNKFGKTTIGTVQSLKVDQRYGDLKVMTAGQVLGSVEFANVDFGTLLRSADLKLKYCTRADLGTIAPGVDMVKLNTNFTSIYMHLSENTNLAINISTSFGKLNNRQKWLDLADLDDADDSHYSNDSHYRGRTGNGRGSMDITAHYGNVRFE